MKKRLLGLIMASILIMSLLPTIAFAAATEMDGAAFLASADESGVISLTEDTTVTSSVAISTGAYTVALNGHTLSGNGNFVLFNLSGDASLTVTGPGTVTGRCSTASYGGQHVFQTAGSASLTLQGSEGESLAVYGDSAAKSTIRATGSGNVTVQYADVYGVDGGSSSAASALSWASSGTLLVEHSSIHGGDTVGSRAEGGAALEIQGAKVSLRDSRLYGGDSKYYNAGSAIETGSVSNLNLEIDGCTIEGGNVTDAGPSYGIGGNALYTTNNTSAPTITITGSTLTGGDGGYSYRGSGIYLFSPNSTMSISDSIISGADQGTYSDQSGNQGNAIYTASGKVKSLSMTNVTLWADLEGAGGYNELGYVIYPGKSNNSIPITASGQLTISGGALANVTITSADANAPVDIVTTNESMIRYNGTVTVDGDSYAPFEVHKADGTVEKYNTFSKAVAAAENGDTIAILEKMSFGSSVTIDKAVTVTGMDKLDVGYYTLIVTAGTYDGDISQYVGLGCQGQYDDTTGRWTVAADPAAQLVAKYEAPANGPAIITLAGDLANGVGDGVRRENGAITVDFRNGEPYVYSMDVTLSAKALTSIAAGLEAEETVSFLTDAGNLTFDKEAWRSITDNAAGGSVYLHLTNGSSYNEITAVSSAGDSVFDYEDPRSGAVSVSVPCRKTAPASYESMQVYGYNKAGTYLDGIEATLDPDTNTLTWTADCFAAFTPVFFTGTEEAVAQKPSTGGYYTLQVGTLEEVLKFDSFTTSKIVQLVGDVSDAELEIPAGKNVYLDLNGHTLDCAAPIAVNGSLTVKNGTIAGLESGFFATGENGAVTVENCTFLNDAGEQVTEGVVVPAEGQIVITVESDGVTLKMETIQSGDRFTLPGAPEKDGYTFMAWSDGENNYAAGTTVENITAATTFTALWSQNATSLTLNKTRVMLYSNARPNTVTLTAIVTPEGASDVITWTTDAPAVATVEDGVVTAVGNGIATITATARGGASATCTVMVKRYSSGSGNVPSTAVPDDDDKSTALPFTDVAKRDWFYDAVYYAYVNKLMDGVAATAFNPQADTSRAMLVTILWRLEGSPVVNYAMDFGDVADGQWYTEAVRWAASEKIVDGMGDGTFMPDAAVTRQQMAAILYRYADYKGYDVTKTADLSTYTDSADVQTYARTAMAWANAEGLITGVTDTTLVPAGSTTRAQTATILMRFAENVVK